MVNMKLYFSGSTDYHMIIRAKSDLNVSSAARLISFPQAAGQIICVSFWYHIFGNSIGMHSSVYITVVSLI